MAQNLNEVQRAFVNGECRPLIEDLIRFRARLDAFVVDYDNQQTPIVSTAEVLNDGTGGTVPRSDAPTLTGSNLLQLRNFAASMRDQINTTALNALVALAVRSVNDIIRS